MKERGMIFNTEMVKAILEGRKTQTRRPVKPPFEKHPNGYITKRVGNNRFTPYESPFGVPGDIIYVRETWCDSLHSDGYEVDGSESVHTCYGYLASGKYACGRDVPDDVKWNPSIHMPRIAAQIFLQITDVRVERVRDISEEDAIAEGIKNLGFTEGNPHKALYAQLYESIYGPDSWEKDWVWVYKFKVL